MRDNGWSSMSRRGLCLLLVLLGCPGAMGGEALWGCNGTPSEPTVVKGPALVFVSPCFPLADTFLREDPTKPQRILDDQLDAQYLRLRERMSAADVKTLKASGAMNIVFSSPRGQQERIRTTRADWRGVIAFCPGGKVKKIKMMEQIPSDAVVLDAIRPCASIPE